MTTFLLVRHAANETIGELIAGRLPDVYLNEAGIAQAARLAERLARVPLAAIYSSPMERALHTARPVALHHGLEIQESNALVEINFGEWTGRSFSELEDERKWQQFNSFRSGTRIPGGELMLEVQTRVVTELEHIRERYREETVAVFSHGDPLKAAAAYYAGIPLDLSLRMELSPASVSVITVNDDGPKILLLNDTGE
ncbi:MAG TPA: histidine phosphatase family protein, partial [Pyrinomonadaceae bacterium]|nr:histidine phosphatase family protein [Pyrinomonadaceae bacterium]